jgi:hypothetical protein
MEPDAKAVAINVAETQAQERPSQQSRRIFTTGWNGRERLGTSVRGWLKI